MTDTFKSAWSNLDRVLGNASFTAYYNEYQQRKVTPMRTRSTSNTPAIRRFRTPQRAEQINSISMKFINELLQARCVDNRIEKMSLDNLCKILEKQCRNGRMDLSGMSLKMHSSRVIAGILEHNDEFTSVVLSNNALGDEGGTCIVRALQMGSNRSIIHLDLSKTSITAGGFKYLLPMLSNVYSLISLNLSYNHMSTIGTQALQELVNEHQNIQHLTLYQTFAGVVRGKFISLDLGFNDLKNTKHLESCEELQLQDNPLKDNGIKWLCCRIYHWQIIQLNLSNTGMTMIGLSMLIDSISHHAYLQVLKLSNNNYQGQMSCISNLLQHNNVLSSLILNNCRINEYTKLSESLLLNKGLKLINLSGNPVQQHGAQLLSQSINRLEYIYLNKCQLKDGVYYIIERLFTSSVKVLEIKDNQIDDLTIVSDLVNKNKNIIKLDASLNIMNYRVQTQLEESVILNRRYQRHQIIPKAQQELNKLAGLTTAIKEVSELGNTVQHKYRQSTKQLEISQSLCTTMKQQESLKTEQLRIQMKQLQQEWFDLNKQEELIDQNNQRIQTEQLVTIQSLKQEIIGQNTQINYFSKQIKNYHIKLDALQHRKSHIFSDDGSNK